MTDPARPMGPLHGDAGDESYAPGSTPAGATRTCIYPGCEQPALGPHPLGGPPAAFCASEQHNALSAHLERRRRAAGSDQKEADDGR